LLRSVDRSVGVGIDILTDNYLATTDVSLAALSFHSDIWDIGKN